MKDLPYFKFNVSEWLNGKITLEDLETQGVFINICARYWHSQGKITLTELKRRLTRSKPTAFESLISAKIIHVKGDIISIKFLDEQLTERKGVSTTNSKNGKLGGRPPILKPYPEAEEKPTALFSESETKAKESNIEKKREEEEKKRIKRKSDFVNEVHEHSSFTFELKDEFLKYWLEENKSKTKFRFEDEKFFDVKRRLGTWLKRTDFKTEKIKQSETSTYFDKR